MERKFQSRTCTCSRRNYSGLLQSRYECCNRRNKYKSIRLHQRKTEYFGKRQCKRKSNGKCRLQCKNRRSCDQDQQSGSGSQCCNFRSKSRTESLYRRRRQKFSRLHRNCFRKWKHYCRISTECKCIGRDRWKQCRRRYQCFRY